MKTRELLTETMKQPVELEKQLAENKEQIEKTDGGFEGS